VNDLSLILVLAALAGAYMAWNVGANDVANAMGTSVGSKAVTLRQALMIAAVFELAGAVLVGGNVTNTIRKGIVDPMVFQDDPSALMFGMLAALLAAALWLNLSTLLGMPVSTTHSIVGGVVGFGVLIGGADAVVWPKMIAIVASWIISPLVGGAMAFLLFRYITRTILEDEHPARAIKKRAPVFVFLVVFMLVLSLIYKGLKVVAFPPSQAILLALGAGVAGALLSLRPIARIQPDRARSRRGRLKMVEAVFRPLQILTACYVAFAHGSNDVANAVGPLAAVLAVHETGNVLMNVPVPVWVLVLGGVGIVLGLFTYGYKVIETIGRKITELTPSRGFTAEFATATTILLGSKLGMPLSTTHVLVGSVMGVGFARGLGAINMRMVRQIMASWLITVPATAVATVLLYPLIKAVL